MRIEEFTFKNDEGNTLVGKLHLPEQVRATALFAHCFTCSQSLLATRLIAQRLAEADIAVLRFDFTGLGGSEGDFSHSDFTTQLSDLDAARRALAVRGFDVDMLIGHSLGGAAVLHQASHFDKLQAVAVIGAPADPGHVTHLLDDKLDEIRDRGQARVTLAGREFCIRKRFLDALEELCTADVLGRLDVPALLLHSPDDDTVGYDNALKLRDSLGRSPTLVSLDGADHLLENAEDAEYVASIIAAWSRRHLILRDVPTRQQEADVVVESVEGRRFLQQVRAGSNRILADEPTSVGGDDDGMSPYELLYAGLGTCTSMTLQMYAARKRWPLRSVHVEVTGDRVHAADSENFADQKAQVLQLQRNITLRGPLDDDQRARLLEIADKCPVHKSLHGPIEILSFLDDDDVGTG